MSVVLDDFARTVVATANGKHVLIDTRYVPFPLGRNNYETSVARCNTNGKVHHWKELDVLTATEKETADMNHAAMINKWMKEVLI